MIKHTFSCRSIIENSNNKPSLSGLLFINKKEPLAEFNAFLNPVLEHIFKTINKQLIILRNQQKNISIEKDNLLNIIENDLHEKLQEMTMRCLVVHINQIENQLSGNTKKEKLAFFIKHMHKKDVINDFFNKYPVLEYRLDLLLNNYLSAKVLFFNKFLFEF